jgi:hypothetical protein
MVRIRVLNSADSVLLPVPASMKMLKPRSEEERQVLATEMSRTHAASVVLDEGLERKFRHDRREEEDLHDLVVAGVILPVRDAFGLSIILESVESVPHPLAQAVAVLEGDVAEAAELKRCPRVGEILVEEDVLDDRDLDLLTESGE